MPESAVRGLIGFGHVGRAADPITALCHRRPDAPVAAPSRLP